MTKAEFTHSGGILLNHLPRTTYRLIRRIIKPSQAGTTFRVLGLITGLLYFGLFASSAGATTWTVSDTADNPSDSNSVRYAINHAKSGDTVTFANLLDGQVIVLTDGPLSISTNIAVQGPGARLLTISGGNSVTVFSLNSSEVTISGLTIANGRAAMNGAGGGVMISGGTVTLTACIFSTNSATSGGAIANAGNLTVSNSTFSGNSAGTLGGGIQNSGALTVTNSTFFGNSAGTSGGAIYNNSGAVALNNTTVSGNSAGTSGGGIFNNAAGQPTPTITAINTIVAGNNTGGTLGSGDCDSCGTQSSSNLIGGAPQLGSLSWNGGPTQTMIPLPGSPVIGAGSYQTGEPVADQRAFNRPSSKKASIDLGAVQTNYVTVTTLSDGSLRAALAAVSSGGSADIVFQTGLVSATSPGTITLLSSLPDITGHLNLSGPGANELTIGGGDPYVTNAHLLMVDAGADAVFSRITINPNGGYPPNSIEGIVNSGTLSVNNCTVSSGSTGIDSSATLIVLNSSFSGDSSGIINSGVGIVRDSTFSDNSTGSIGGAIFNDNILTVSNSSFSNNVVTGYGVPIGFGGGDIYNAGTLNITSSTFYPQSGISNLGSSLTISNSILSNPEGGACAGSGCPENGVDGNIVGSGEIVLSVLGDHGGVTQTMIPAPGSSAICAGSPALLPSGLTSDQRGFPRLNTSYAGFSNSSPCLDAGAVQTNYTSVNFVQQPTNSVVGNPIAPPPTLQVLETNPNLAAPDNTDAVSDIPVTLSFNGTGALEGTLTQLSSGGVATFGDLIVNQAGTGDTLSASLPIVAGATQTAISTPFNVTTLAGNTATHFAITGQLVAYAGVPFSITVTAQDSNNNTATGYSGTVHFTSGDAAAMLPANASVSGGVGTFTVTLFAENAFGTVTVTDTLHPTITGTIQLLVLPGLADRFAVSTPPTAVTGAPFNVTVTAYDVGGNLVTGYDGTVHFTSTDPAATLPADGGLSQGSGTFVATLATLGTQTITATDNLNSSPTGVSGGIVVTTPFNLVVTTAADDTGNAANCTIQSKPGIGTDKACSLRDAITYMNNISGGIITFDSTVFAVSNSAAQNTITLAGPLAVSQGMTIQGPGANVVTVSGGGVGTVFIVSAPGAVTISGLTIANGNASSASDGGGITNASTLTVSDCILAGNITNRENLDLSSQFANGGAILNGGTLTVNNSTFTGNGAYGNNDSEGTFSGNGGAIFNGGGLVVNDSTFFGNIATPETISGAFAGAGGAIFNNCGTLTVNDSTFSGNTADQGGGIYNNLGANYSCGSSPPVTMTNTIVAGNGPGDDCDGCGTQSAYNLISTPGNIINPSLGPIGSYGGPTPTMLPLPGSIAICAGSPALLPAGITTDQRGLPRLNTTYAGYSASNALPGSRSRPEQFPVGAIYQCWFRLQRLGKSDDRRKPNSRRFRH